MARRLYSTLILDEAVNLAKETSLSHAEEVTGVNRETIKQHGRAQLIAGNKVEEARRRRQAKPRGMKYTIEQKIAVVEKAMQFRKYQAQRKAFEEAGRRLGVNGRSVEMQWRRGLIPGCPPSGI